MTPSETIVAIQRASGFSDNEIGRRVGASLVAVRRWKRGLSKPNPGQALRLRELAGGIPASPVRHNGFASHGSLFVEGSVSSTVTAPVRLEEEPRGPILARLMQRGLGTTDISALKARHETPAPTPSVAFEGQIAAGKNTYTYDAHTYHTKVPPQGILSLLEHYLPSGGLLLDPFAGSGMTGVAARVGGLDCILNELSPAACFIADRFCASVDAAQFRSGVNAVLSDLEDIRRRLYQTQCRECGRDTEALYFVWSYGVVCPHCSGEFVLWDHCRSYGRTVRDHKILSEFPCPNCQNGLVKSRLSRTKAYPVQVGYKCCTPGRAETVASLSDADRELIAALDRAPPTADGFYPTLALPAGVNLNQPRRHGLNTVARLYTTRNLAAISQLWRAVHRVDDTDVAGQLAFVCTSLYQRVTRLSEFRFWGGSGNTARLNVPFIFNESNVFLAFERKARSIGDHLATTAAGYRGQVSILNGSATSLSDIGDESVDLIFTDPPFGSNINYSEMNLLWESWLGLYTDPTHEAIVSKPQGKDVSAYGGLMTQAMCEAFRVLRPGHWMLLMFMNSSSIVWEALRSAVLEAGFEIRSVDAFDKEHGTFKQFVSPNTAGYDLVLHCLKPDKSQMETDGSYRVTESAEEFLSSRDLSQYVREFLHVSRDSEVDLQLLYSEWTAVQLAHGGTTVDLATFRAYLTTQMDRDPDLQRVLQESRDIPEEHA